MGRSTHGVEAAGSNGGWAASAWGWGGAALHSLLAKLQVSALAASALPALADTRVWAPGAYDGQAQRRAAPLWWGVRLLWHSHRRTVHSAVTVGAPVALAALRAESGLALQ